MVSTIRRSFFSSWRGQYGKQKSILHIRTYAHSHTHARTHNTPLTTHQKAFRVSFYCLFYLCFGILPLPLLLLLLLDSAGHFVCFVSISVCHVDFYYYLWPSSDTQELNSRCTKQRPITTKKGKRREFPLYGVQKRKSKTYIHTHTTTTRSTRTTHSAPMQLPPNIINNQTQSQ